MGVGLRKTIFLTAEAHVYEREGDYERAIRCYEEMKQYEKVKEMFAKLAGKHHQKALETGSENEFQLAFDNYAKSDRVDLLVQLIADHTIFTGNLSVMQTYFKRLHKLIDNEESKEKTVSLIIEALAKQNKSEGLVKLLMQEFVETVHKSL